MTSRDPHSFESQPRKSWDATWVHSDVLRRPTRHPWTEPTPTWGQFDSPQVLRWRSCTVGECFRQRAIKYTNSKLKKCVIPFNSIALCPLLTKASSRLIKSSNDPQESGQICWTNRKPLPMPAFPPLIWFEDFNKSASILKLGDIFVHWRLIASVEEDGPKCCAMCFKAT